MKKIVKFKWRKNNSIFAHNVAKFIEDSDAQEPFILCADGVRQYFGLERKRSFEVHVSAKKPAHEDHYLLHRFTYGFAWFFADVEGADSPWPPQVDHWLNMNFLRREKLYMWVEIDA